MMRSIRERNWKRLVMAYAVTQGLVGVGIMNIPLLLILAGINDRSVTSIATGLGSVALGSAIAIASANIYEKQQQPTDTEEDGIEMQELLPSQIIPRSNQHV